MKKYIKYILIILVSLTIFFYVNKNNYMEKIYIKNKFLSSLNITSKFLEIRNYKTYQEENKILNEKLINNNTLIEKTKTQENEINDLKSLLELKKIYTSYNLIYSTVILNNLSANTFTIDKGKNSNIKKNSPVINSDGLIGIIDTLYEDTSIVKLISSKNYNISIKINDIYGALSYYKDNKYIVKDINISNNIKINDKVYTTGLGNLPSGILIGTVQEIKQDDYGISNILLVRGFDFNNTKYVAVLGEDI